MRSFCAFVLLFTLLGIVMAYRDSPDKCYQSPRSYGPCNVKAHGYTYDSRRNVCRRIVLRCMASGNYFFDKESCEYTCLKYIQ
ncbi:kunitz-type serine protease inhibitor kunitoxin-Tel1 [Drosophila sechellia]|uniref:kunitz-type serine protease inhibitor kunitoxin-Tel1 n=1 Tax=Drosophila sechellia TaxID=7238 RepID=UPI0013DE7097|nr:kunitz-type serine protease inhibitor kunitoxin-Tel1 [Drosophila sechellia]